MNYEIDVREVDQQKTFVLGTDGSSISFNKLCAMDEFQGGRLQVFRNGELYSETDNIDLVGTMGGYTVFNGLNKLFHDKAKPQFIADLDVSLFEAGDKILIEYKEPASEGFHTLTSFLQMQERIRLKKESQQTVGSP